MHSFAGRCQAGSEMGHRRCAVAYYSMLAEKEFFLEFCEGIDALGGRVDHAILGAPTTCTRPLVWKKALEEAIEMRLENSFPKAVNVEGARMCARQ